MRKVRPVGEVERHPWRDAVLEIETGVRLVPPVIDREVVAGGSPGEYERLQRHVATRRHRRQVAERAGSGHQKDPIAPLQRRPVGDFVLPSDPPEKIRAPRLIHAGGIEPQRGPGDRKLHGPSRVVDGGAEIDDAVPPVIAGRPVVEPLAVLHAAARIDEEEKGIAPVEKGIE